MNCAFPPNANMTADISCPYTYEAMCSRLYSSSAPPDLIYFLEAFILHIFADVSLETVAQLKDNLDRALALTYLALTLQLAFVEALAFDVTTAEQTTTPVMTRREENKPSSVAALPEVHVVTRPALAVLAQKTQAHSSTISFDSALSMQTSRSSSFSSRPSSISSQSSRITTITDSPITSSQCSSYSSQSSPPPFTIKTQAAQLTKLSSLTSSNSALTIRRGRLPVPSCLKSSIPRHKTSSASLYTIPQHTSTYVSKAEQWPCSIVTASDTTESSPINSINHSRFLSATCSCKDTSEARTSCRSTKALAPKLIDESKGKLPGLESVRVPRLASVQLAAHKHLDRPRWNAKLLPPHKALQHEASSALPMPPRPSKKRLAAAIRNIFPRWPRRGTQADERKRCLAFMM